MQAVDLYNQTQQFVKQAQKFAQPIHDKARLQKLAKLTAQSKGTTSFLERTPEQRAALIERAVYHKMPRKRAKKTVGKKTPQPKNKQNNKLVAVPVSIGQRTGYGRGPAFSGTAGRLRVAHREYFSDIVGSVLFSNIQIAVNPGLSNLMPWLNRLAVNWERYRFVSLRFIYQTFRPTTDTGTVILAFDPDATDYSPQNKSEVLGYADNVRSNTYLPSSLSISATSLAKATWRYVRNEATPADYQDARLNDAGLLNVSVEGQASSAAIGELSVEYVVEFETPQTMTSAALSSATIGSTGLSNAAPMGLTAGRTFYGSAPVDTLSNSTANLFHKAGAWFYNLAVDGTGFTSESPTITLSAGTTVGLTTAYAAINAAATSLSQSLVAYVDDITTGFGGAGAVEGGLGFTLAYPTAWTSATAAVSRLIEYGTHLTLAPTLTRPGRFHKSVIGPSTRVLRPDLNRPVKGKPGWYHSVYCPFGPDGYPVPAPLLDECKDWEQVK